MGCFLESQACHYHMDIMKTVLLLGGASVAGLAAAAESEVMEESKKVIEDPEATCNMAFAQGPQFLHAFSRKLRTIACTKKTIGMEDPYAATNDPCYLAKKCSDLQLEVGVSQCLPSGEFDFEPDNGLAWSLLASEMAGIFDFDGLLGTCFCKNIFVSMSKDCAGDGADASPDEAKDNVHTEEVQPGGLA